MAPRTITAPCTITVRHTSEFLEAHVELEGDAKPSTGDRVLVHGDAVRVAFGESVTIRRQATLIRAGLLQRLWVRLMSRLHLTELYEVSFSSMRLK